MTDAELQQRFFSGDRIALARMLTRAENAEGQSDAVLDAVFARAGDAYRIGITGPPGAGKSTLLDRLVLRYRDQGRSVGVVAVDPSSPFSGGAILGDRIRMNSVQQDPQVFIRSMATRGSLGGLAYRTQEIADVFAAFGKDIIFLETVGVGQSELDVIQAADTIVVVLVPESGDSIQAMKAGLMEIADLFVLNKSDHDNARNAYADLKSILHLNSGQREWQPTIVQTVAHQDKGIDDLVSRLEAHRTYLIDHDQMAEKHRKRVRDRLRAKIDRSLHADFWRPVRLDSLDKAVEKILQGKLSYGDALETLKRLT